MTGFKISDTVDLDSAGARAVGQIVGTKGDAGAHTWVIGVVRGGEAVDLSGMSAVMKVVRADGATVAVPASVSGNVIEVSFPASCYAVEGLSRVLMRLTDPVSHSEMVIAGLMLAVSAGETGVVVDSGEVVATLDQMLAGLSAILTAEAGRVTAESGRADAEAARVSAESARAARLSVLEADRLALDALVTRTAVGKCLTIPDAAAGTGLRVIVAGAAGETANLTVCGRNLFNEASVPYENLASGFSFSGGKIRYTNTDGTWRHVQFRCRGLRPGGVYLVSCLNAQGTNIVIGFEQRNAANALVGAAFYLYGNGAKVFMAEPDIAYLNVKFTSPGTNTVCDYSLNLMVEEGSYGSAYEAYAGTTETVGSNTAVQKTAQSPTHVFTDDMARVISAVYLAQPPVESPVIAAFGDSLTLGSGGSATNFPAKLAELTGRSVVNLGVGGEDSLTIAGRQGGIPFVAQPFTIPAAATPVEVTLKSGYLGKSVAPLVNGSAGVNPCFIGGIRGTLSYSGGKYYFTRAVQGTASVAVTRPQAVVTDAMRLRQGDIAVFWVGTNGGWVDTDNVTYNPDVLVAQLKLMTGVLTTGRFLVIGLTALTAAQYANLDARLARAFGRKFLDLRGYMLSYGLQDAGITPTAQDNADIASGMIPSSLRYDQTHFNDAGYAIAGTQVFRRMQELGYV